MLAILTSYTDTSLKVMQHAVNIFGTRYVSDNESNVELMFVMMLHAGKKLRFLELFKQYFENICSNYLMIKMKLKLLGFLA